MHCFGILQCFLDNQSQLYPEPVAETPEEAEAFLEDCMAVVVDSVREVLRPGLVHRLSAVHILLDVLRRHGVHRHIRALAESGIHGRHILILPGQCHTRIDLMAAGPMCRAFAAITTTWWDCLWEGSVRS